MTAAASNNPSLGMLLPGATIGMLGSGQLGRMFAQAAARMGYRVHVFSPEQQSPTGQVAHLETIADYEDQDALNQFARSVDVVTLEFENIPLVALETVQQHVPVCPEGNVLHTTQNRLREKRFLRHLGIPCTAFAEVNSWEQLRAAVETIGLPAVLKTADAGYDGKGQAVVCDLKEAENAWRTMGEVSAILESWIQFRHELSVIVARSTTGEVETIGPIANEHERHILDVSCYPHPDLQKVADDAQQIARSIVEKLSLEGVSCVEFFLTADDQLFVNEIAPRPHNSGHLTIEACSVSQFELQARAICGLPLGNPRFVSPAAMANLLGDLWLSGIPRWEAALADGDVRLHLYGKNEALPGRKMGHVTVLAESAETAARKVRETRRRLMR